VNVALTVPELPSVTVTSAIETLGGASSSMIVPPPLGSAIVACVAAVRFSAYVSLTSSIRSLLTLTVTCFVVSPGAKVTEPLRAW
jgi:hypothetical protein